MNKLDFRTMLPTQARKTLFNVLLQKLEEAQLDYCCRPLFTMIEAYQEFDGEQHDWVRQNLLRETFELAYKEWERKHPLCWNNETQEAFRK